MAHAATAKEIPLSVLSETDRPKEPSTSPVPKPEGESRIGLYNSAAFATLLALLGHTVLGFEQSVLQLIVAVSTGYATALALEYVDARFNGRRALFTGGWKNFIIFLVPSHMTVLTTSFIIYVGSELWSMAAVASLGVASKYLFKVRLFGRSRHFMNPSNFAISASFFLIPWVTTLPYEYTTFTHGWLDWLVPAVLVMLGVRLNLLFTKRIPLVLAWWAGFFVQAVVRHVLFDINLYSALMPFTSVAFLLFSFYMITDPMTSARSLKGQVATGLAIGTVYGLIVSRHVVFGLFFSVTIVCFARGLLIVWDNWREAKSRAPVFAWMR